MPSPVGHALGGLAAGWLLQPTITSRPLQRGVTLACAALGMAADLDLLIGLHRGPTHSIGATIVVFVAAWAALAGRPNRARLAVAAAAAYGSHALLDWLGSDTSPPLGLQALWPWSTVYYQSPWQLFSAVSRRFHQPELFWVPNALALGRELGILLPVVGVVYFVRRKTGDRSVRR